MFFHGIYYQYIRMQYPILTPRRTLKDKNKKQLEDRKHLIEKFGLEPVHLLENSSNYSILNCLRSCFEFGDTIFVFERLSQPYWQLSRNEVAVPLIDLRAARWIATSNESAYSWLRKRFPTIPVVHFCRKR